MKLREQPRSKDLLSNILRACTYANNLKGRANAFRGCQRGSAFSLSARYDKEDFVHVAAIRRGRVTLVERVWIETVCTLVKSGLYKYFRHESALFPAADASIRVYSSANRTYVQVGHKGYTIACLRREKPLRSRIIILRK